MMQTLGSAASVIASIREDADAEVQRIEETSTSELAAIRRDAEHATVAIDDREEQLAAARRANEERIARQEWDGRRAAIEQREAWIGRVIAAAQERWTRGERAARCEQLNALLRESLARMPKQTCDVAVAAHDRDLVDVQGARLTTAAIAGGCIVSAENVSVDNSFESRARRLAPEWRNALSGMYKP